MQSLFYRNWRLLLLTLILIMVWGVSSFLSLPKLEDPEFAVRDAIVRTILPGADAQRVENLVTDKIESQLKDVKEIDFYESTSRAGISIVQIRLSYQVKLSETALAWSRIRDRLNDVKVELPPEASEPDFEEVDVKAFDKIVALTWQKDTEPNYAILARRAEALQVKLENLPGTEKVEIYGEPREEITVEIDSAKLVALNLSVEQLSRQIEASDAKISGGQFRSSQNNIALEVESEFDSVDRIRKIPINFGSEGQIIKLGDIATVKKGIEQPPNDLALVDGRNAIALAVFVRSDYQLQQWADRAEGMLEQYREELPTALNLESIFDQSKYLSERLNQLLFNLLFGGFLVIFVSLLMMGWRSSLIVGASLPLSVAIVFGGMKVLNIPIHQISIIGLVVALGLLIDNAIVVVDEVNKYLKQGNKPEVAILKTVKYLFVPLLASTLTTVLAFMPIATLSGAAGEFVGTIGLSVIIAICSSLFLSLTVIPALVAIFNDENKSTDPAANFSKNINFKALSTNLEARTWLPSRSQPWWQVGFSHPILTYIYSISLRYCFTKPIVGVIIALILPVTGFLQGIHLQNQFFAPAERDLIQIELELPTSTAIDRTQTIANQVRELILQRQEVAKVSWFVGRNAPKIYYNLAEGKNGESNYAQAIVQLNRLATDSFVNDLQAEVDENFPVARILVRRLEQGPTFEAPVEMRIYGTNLDELRILGQQARTVLTQIPQVTHTRDSYSEVTPQLKLSLDEEKANLTGLDNAQIARQLQAYLEGTTGGSLLESTTELPVRVRIIDSFRGDINAINSLDLLPVASAQNSIKDRSLKNIPLSALGEINLVPENSVINRRNGQRYNLVQGYINSGVLASDVLDRFQTGLKAANFQLPSGYYTEIGGEAEESNIAIGQILSNLNIIVVLMVSVLVLGLGSFKLAAIVGIVGIAAIGLSLFSLWLFGFPLGFMSIIGSVGLVGVAVNDSVVVLAALLANSEAKIGNLKAVRQVVLHSTRHVTTTTLTTAIGFLPLLLEGGGMWPPMAIVFVSGVCGATLLALYFVPCAYLLVLDRSRLEPKIERILKTQKSEAHRD